MVTTTGSVWRTDCRRGALAVRAAAVIALVATLAVCAVPVCQATIADRLTARGGSSPHSGDVTLSGRVVPLNTTRPMPSASYVTASGTAIGDMTFGQMADCRLRQYLTDVGRLTSRYPPDQGALLQLAQGLVSCTIVGAVQPVSLCKGGEIYTSGVYYPGQAAATCNLTAVVTGHGQVEPGGLLFAVAVYTGRWIVKDPAGKIYTLSAMQELSCDPDDCVAHLGRASFSDAELGDFQAEAAQLTFVVTTTTITVSKPQGR